MPLTPKQKEIRSTRSGGSDIATLLDENPFESLLELYAEKVTAPEKEEEQTDAQSEGDLMEETCARWAATRLYPDDDVIETKRWEHGEATEGTLLHAKHGDILCASPDRIVVPKHMGPAIAALECKYVGPEQAKKWGDPDTDQVPAMYALQVMTERMVVESILGREVDVALVAFLHGRGFMSFDVPRNADLESVILEAATYFKEKHLDPRIPPEPLGRLDSLQRAVKLLYPRSKPRTLVATGTTEALMEAHRENYQLAKQYEELAKRQAVDLQVIMREDCECLESPRLGKILWKNEKPRMEFDAAAFRADHEDLYNDYVVQKPPRRPFKPYYKE